ncbi:MAG: TrmB family transcriptional regulator [Promethearchaeota archaeon]
MHPVPEKVIKALEDINLTQYEISLYLTLIQKGPLNARELSDESSVPYSRIYNILSLLLEKGFITRDDSSRPSTFVANSPDEALMLARKRLIDDFEKNSKVIVSELMDIYLKKIDVPFQMSLIVYRGEEQVYYKAHQIIDNASDSIFLALSSLKEVKRHGLIDLIKEKYSKGTRNVKILIEESSKNRDDEKSIISELSGFGEIRERDQLFGTGITVDKQDAIVILKANIFGMSSYFGIQSDHQAFGPIASYYFDYLFHSASQINT